MGYEWMIPILVIVIVLSLLMSLLGAFGLNPAAVIFAIRSTRRIRTEQQPRDHHDRWVQLHRRSARDSKPKLLRHVWTTGDEDVPRKWVGRVVGAEPWKTYNVLFVKSRRWSWSVPYIVDQALCSDLNRRNLWVSGLGFSSMGPVRIPIPLASEGDVEDHLNGHLDGFSVTFEAQVRQDIGENSAWDIGNAMDPPIRDRARAAETQQPALTDREFMAEETATGG